MNTTLTEDLTVKDRNGNEHFIAAGTEIKDGVYSFDTVTKDINTADTRTTGTLSYDAVTNTYGVENEEINDIKTVEQKQKEQEKNINKYKEAIKAAHKAKTVTKSSLKNVLSLASKAGYSASKAAKDLAGGDGNGGVTYVEVAKAAKKLGYS